METPIGVELKIRRIRTGAKQYEIAFAAGMSQSTLSLIENQRRPIWPEELIKIESAIAQVDVQEGITNVLAR